jgi:hypothetical protein
MATTGKILDLARADSAKDVGGELATATQALALRLRDSRITDLVTLEQAVADRRALGEALKRVAAFFAPLKKMAYDLHKALCDRENEVTTPLKTLDEVKRRAIGDFKAAQDRIRQQQEQVLADARRRDEQDRAAATAAQLERSGEAEMAAQVLAEAIAAPAPVVVLPDETQQIEGLHFTRRYLWRYAGGPQDLDQTPPAVVARTMELIPRTYLQVDEKKVGAIVRASKGTIAIPGLDIYYVDDPRR